MMDSYLKALQWAELAEECIEWNENTLPENNIYMQYLKIAEEVEEYKQAKTKNEQEKEAADIFISVIGLLRFCKKDLKKARVVSKLETLKKRKLKIINGTYHH